MKSRSHISSKYVPTLLSLSNTAKVPLQKHYYGSSDERVFVIILWSSFRSDTLANTFFLIFIFYIPNSAIQILVFFSITQSSINIYFFYHILCVNSFLIYSINIAYILWLDFVVVNSHQRYFFPLIF